MAAAKKKAPKIEMGKEKQEFLSGLGFDTSSNGRKGNEYGPNKMGKECIAKIAKAVGAKKGALAIVPQYSTGTEKVVQGSLPTVPKGITTVTVPLTKAQVKQWAQHWAKENGRTAFDHRGIVVVK